MELWELINMVASCKIEIIDKGTKIEIEGDNGMTTYERFIHFVGKRELLQREIKNFQLWQKVSTGKPIVTIELV